MSWLLMRQTGVDPARRAWHTLEVTPTGGKMILFGGFDGDKQYYNDILLNDRGLPLHLQAQLRPPTRASFFLSHSPPAKQPNQSIQFAICDYYLFIYLFMV
jgi:hypothetical protein